MKSLTLIPHDDGLELWSHEIEDLEEISMILQEAMMKNIEEWKQCNHVRAAGLVCQLALDYYSALLEDLRAEVNQFERHD